ncbi:hypothetical protein R3P38DRAFT_2447507, partial [Favolaschia claudopus]
RVMHQALLPGATSPTKRTESTQLDRCAVCVKQYCDQRFECPGKGKQKSCKCSDPPLRDGEKVRISEEQI